VSCSTAFDLVAIAPDRVIAPLAGQPQCQVERSTAMIEARAQRAHAGCRMTETARADHHQPIIAGQQVARGLLAAW